VITSSTITVTGTAAANAISVANGEYSIDGGAFTTAAGTINNAQTVAVRQTSSALPLTGTTTTLTIGTISDGFTVTTIAADITPDAFAFVDQTNVALATVIPSAAVTINGITAATAISVTTGGEYSINGGAFTAVAGTVTNGQTVTVRQTSSALPLTATTTTLTIGTISDGFTVTTIAADITPDAFAFVDVIDQAISAPITSNAVTIIGINAATAISVSGNGGTYSINGGAFTAVAGTVTSGQTVAVRQTSSATPATATTTTLTVGGVSDDFSVTTVAADTTPTAFSFVDVTNAVVSTVSTSNTVTIAGINTATPISVSGNGGTYSINGGAFTAVAGTVTSGQTVAVRQTSSAAFATATNTVLTVGTVSDTYTVTTVAEVTGSIEIDGGSSSVDGMMLGLLGLLAALVGRGAARRRKIAGA